MAKFEAFRSQPFDITGGGPPGGGAAPPESQAGGTEGGKPKALSQPVDPGGVGGLLIFRRRFKLGKIN